MLVEFLQDKAGMLLVALIRLMFFINMILDWIKSDQDSGAYNRPIIYFYQPTHVSGLAFLFWKKANPQYFTGSSAAYSVQWIRQSSLSVRFLTATRPVKKTIITRRKTLWIFSCHWTSEEDNHHLDKGIGTALHLPTSASPLKVPSAINGIQMKSIFKLCNTLLE